MRKHVFDWHLSGMLGALSISGAISLYSNVVGAIAVTATASYAVLRFIRYWRKVEPVEKQTDLDI